MRPSQTFPCAPFPMPGLTHTLKTIALFCGHVWAQLSAWQLLASIERRVFIGGRHSAPAASDANTGVSGTSTFIQEELCRRDG
jgi:hypothetical protein